MPHKNSHKTLLDLLQFFNIKNNLSPNLGPILGGKLDSREIQPGDVFIALKGGKLDGEGFIQEAIQKGAIAVLKEASFRDQNQISHLSQNSVPILEIKNLKQYLPALGMFFENLEDLEKYHFPIFAVTGTNGKTTISTLLAEFLEEKKCAVIGSLGAGFLGELKHTGINTPDPIKVGRLFKNLISEGAQAFSMEASSHGLDQARIEAIPITVGIFTNLTQDHLDYHLNLKNYAKAKSNLFKFKTLELAVLNHDDEVSSYMEEVARAHHPNLKILKYGLGELSQDKKNLDVWLSRCEINSSGYELTVETPKGSFETTLNLMGEFNLSNYLAVVAALVGTGFNLEKIKKKTPKLYPPKGRMEIIKKPGLATVIIDYAHTPDALEKVLSTLRKHTAGQLWVVFGCGGDRDRTKRPIMASIAERLADRVIVTGDNMRFEDPQQIFGEICAGFSNQDRYELTPDRRLAIQMACQKAGPDDLILLAGKGHELYLESQGMKHFFDERDYIFGEKSS